MSFLHQFDYASPNGKELEKTSRPCTTWTFLCSFPCTLSRGVELSRISSCICFTSLRRMSVCPFQFDQSFFRDKHKTNFAACLSRKSPISDGIELELSIQGLNFRPSQSIAYTPCCSSATNTFTWVFSPSRRTATNACSGTCFPCSQPGSFPFRCWHVVDAAFPLLILQWFSRYSLFVCYCCSPCTWICFCLSLDVFAMVFLSISCR